MQTKVIVWAVEFTQTHETKAHPKGYGGSTKPLSVPKPTETSFHYRARWPQPIGANSVVGASNGSGGLRSLAENFAINYRQFPQSEAEPVHIENGPDDEEIMNSGSLADGMGVARPLTLDELSTFLAAFQEAREKSAVKV